MKQIRNPKKKDKKNNLQDKPKNPAMRLKKIENRLEIHPKVVMNLKNEKTKKKNNLRNRKLMVIFVKHVIIIISNLLDGVNTNRHPHIDQIQ